MPSRGNKARKRGQTSRQKAKGAPVTSLDGIARQFFIYLAACAIVVSRRPDALFNAQFWAEDGVFFYRAAYESGLHSLVLLYGGYLHSVLRMAALLAQLFPLSQAPLVMNLVGLTFQVLPVNVFLSSRFSQIDLRIRLLGSFMYLAIPNSFEIDVNSTNVQWHMAVLACVVLFAQPSQKRGWRIFDAAVLALTSLSSPMGILLLPVAALLWWKRRETESATSLAILFPGALIQAVCVLLHWHGRQQPHIDFAGNTIFNGGSNGASLGLFAAIVGRQVFLSSLLGLSSQGWFLQFDSVSLIEVAATLLGLAVLLYALRYAPLELKLLILFASAVITLGLMNPLAGPPDHPQWFWLSHPGNGNRYYFMPMIAFLGTLLWMATRKNGPRMVRFSAIGLLLLLPVGIYQDWEYRPFQDFHFQEYAAHFESVHSGTKVMIPVNPDWLMELTKR